MLALITGAIVAFIWAMVTQDTQRRHELDAHRSACNAARGVLVDGQCVHPCEP